MSKKLVLRSFGDGRDKEWSDTAVIECLEPTLAQQQFVDENNPEIIMKKFAHQPDLLAMALYQKPNARYGDFTLTPDSYHHAMNMIIEAQDAFDSLDAHIRRRFDNDPANLLAFLSDEANSEEARSLGLIPPSETTSTGQQTASVDSGDTPTA